MSQKHLSNLQLTWADLLLKFSFTIFYCPEKINNLPDHLSRLFPNTPIISNVTTSINSSQNSSTEPLAFEISAEDPNDSINSYTALALKYEKAVPRLDERKRILEECHILSHASSDELYKEIWRKGYVWPSLRMKCDNFVSSCIDCMRNTIVKRGVYPQVSLAACLPMDHLVIDLLGPLPPHHEHIYVMVCIDVFTRFNFLKPLKGSTTLSVSTSILDIIYVFGQSKILQCD